MKGRGARRDSKTADLGENVEQLIGQAVGEVLVLRIVAPIDERQDSDRCELVFGRFLRETPGARERVYFATKLGRFSPPGWPENFSRAGIRQHTEASLRRLGVEALDLTQLHCIPFAELQRGEVFQHLRELRREGKIRDFGVSVETMQQSVPSTTGPVVIAGGAPVQRSDAPTATLVIGTHEAEEAALAATVEALAASEVVTAISSVLRVEGS